MMRVPLIKMEERIADILGGNSTSKLRYLIYSAHDDQISNMFEWLHPVNVALDYVIFASTITFELMYSELCVQSETASDECFTINVIWNGEPLLFKECGDSVCSYTDFKTHIGNIWYDGAFAEDLDLACTQQSAKPYGSTETFLN